MNKRYVLAATFFIMINNIYCSTNNGNKNTAATVNKEQTSEGKIYFSCTVNGMSLSDNRDGGILDPMTKMLLDVGENENYTVGIRIPPDLKAGEACKGCKGFVHEKIKREGMDQRKTYEHIQDISVVLSSREKGYAAGTFSFSVKMKEDSDKTIAVTDGKFAMSITNE